MTWRIDPKTLKNKVSEHKTYAILAGIVVVALLAHVRIIVLVCTRIIASRDPKFMMVYRF